MSDIEFKAALVRMGHRFARHYRFWLEGEIGSDEDLAAILRTLIDDDVLGRAIRQFKLTSPLVAVGSDADDQKSTLFSVGAVLIPEGFDELPEITHSQIPYSVWRNRTCLVVDGVPGKRVNTWRSTVSMIANTFGSHTSPTISPVLDRTRLNVFGDSSIADFLLKNAADVAHVVLSSIFEQLSLKASGMADIDISEQRPVTLAWLRAHDLGSQGEVRVIPGIRAGVKPGLYPVIDLLLRDEARMHMSVFVSPPAPPLLVTDVRGIDTPVLA
ncbi:hypothetical protein HQQ82_19245 [Rathayibacter sp. VKM Ac-2856]|uniref:hypothetical protein n=1 Tax=unclassified Rathayibacter TaxID=2609250 RepID=UPI0015657EE7|nr:MULTISPECIES: hypothetical protein [unclassified Rathayibacter]NQX06909.1 hypothetical protein [Rathayibacter sp. VKM Ac-2858]NQX22108.1 hypothetical protein [Rathayibacter sp. VKM Ac-2856]